MAQSREHDDQIYEYGATASATGPPTPTLAPEVAPPAPPPPPAGPTPPKGRRTMWIAVVAVVVVVVVVIAALVLLMGSNSGGGTSATIGMATPYSQALPLAVTADASQSGGPWTLVAGLGLGLASGVVGPNLATLGNSDCVFTPAPGSPSTISFPGTASTAAAGTVATWIFFAKNASASVILWTEVSDGSAAPLELTTGTNCIGSFEELSTISGTSVVDSTVVAAAMNSGGGSGFLLNHTDASQEFGLFGGVTADGDSPVWSVSYTTCAFMATTGGSGTGINAYYNATTGAVLTAPTVQTGETR
jgi:hypothetical protein